jgi:hypothetical protein
LEARAATVERATEMAARLPPGLLDAWAASGRERSEALAVAAALRPEDVVMTPASMRAMTPTALSFANTLVARMVRNRWRISRPVVEIDGDARGTLVYEIAAEGATFHFGIHSDPVPTGPGDGRLRENRFDFYGTLVDGPLDRDHLEHDLATAVAEVWGGRSSSRSFGWTFANRSKHGFDEVLDGLAAGCQPDIARIAADSGYIVRNAGFYGNGRHATRAWASIPADHPLSFPYHVDLLCLYLWRTAALDLVEAAARARDPQAASLPGDARRRLGIGNSSGIGTVAALVRWPSSLSAFMFAREFALAYARTRPVPAEESQRQRLAALLERAADDYAAQPERDHAVEQPRDVALALREVAARAARPEPAVQAAAARGPRAWEDLIATAERTGSPEACERLNALLIELHPEVVELLLPVVRETMRMRPAIVPEMPVAELREELWTHYRWALEIDFGSPGAREHFWYKSDENGENRRGIRAVDPGVEFETFVDVAGAVQQLDAALAALPGTRSVGRFLLEQPRHAIAVTRVQLAARLPYSELRANVIEAGFRPCDAIRCFLGVLGLERPDPASVQWVRGVFFQDAPVADELAAGAAEPAR